MSWRMSGCRTSATTYCKHLRSLSLSIPVGCFVELHVLSAGDGREAISTTRWRTML